MALKNKVATALLTDVGRVRTNNEDAVAEDEEIGLLVLADGMGGYNAGEVASSICNETLLAAVKRDLPSLRKKRYDSEVDTYRPQTLMLKQAVEEAHRAIFETAQKQPQCAGMGTTVVAVYLYDDRMSIAHVGDSRLYRFRFGDLTQITRDHSLQEELIARGQYSREDAERLVRKNIVTRALGVEDKVEVELNERSVEVGDLLMLCSDGLSDVISSEQMRVSLRRYHDDLAGAARDLVQQALKAGGKDNVSVALARVDRSFARSRAWYSRIMDWF